MPTYSRVGVKPTTPISTSKAESRNYNIDGEFYDAKTPTTPNDKFHKTSGLDYTHKRSDSPPVESAGYYNNTTNATPMNSQYINQSAKNRMEGMVNASCRSSVFGASSYNAAPVTGYPRGGYANETARSRFSKSPEQSYQYTAMQQRESQKIITPMYSNDMKP